MSALALGLLTDLELIDHYLLYGPGWPEAKRLVHDALAARVRARGRIVHGRYTYLPSDDGSFQRVPIGRGPTDLRGLGRAVETAVGVSDADRNLARRRYGRDSDH